MDTYQEFDRNNLITYETFMALVDAVIPRTPALAELYGAIMYYGALDFYTDEYLVMILNQDTIPLYPIAADLLNLSAEEYIAENLDTSLFSNEYPLYAQLNPQDRLRLLSILEQNAESFSDRIHIEDYPALLSEVILLARYTMMGYYSEWYGYGTTRLYNPNQRVLQYYPPSWEQVEYPGPSLSYISYVAEYTSLKKNI